MSKSKKITASSDVETLNNNEATNAQDNATALQGTPTSEPVKADVAPVKIDAIAEANKKAFDSIQGIGLETLKQVFTVLFLAFQERMKALKELLGDSFDESAFWADDDIAKSVINGATLEHQGYDASGKPKMVKNQLNAKIAALAVPFIVGLGIRTAEQFTAILSTRKDNSLSQLAKDAYSYAKVLSIIPALAKVGLLTNTKRADVYTYARNEFKKEVIADFALKHVCEYSKADCDLDAMKENKLSIEDIKTVQLRIKAYNTQLKESKTDKAIAEPAKLSWGTVLLPVQTVAAIPADLTLVAPATTTMSAVA